MPKKGRSNNVLSKSRNNLTAYQHAENRESVMLHIIQTLQIKDCDDVVIMLRSYADEIERLKDIQLSEVQQDLYLLANEIY